MVSAEMVSKKDRSVCAVDKLLVAEGVIPFGRRKQRRVETNLEEGVCVGKKKASVAAVRSDNRYKWFVGLGYEKDVVCRVGLWKLRLGFVIGFDILVARAKSLIWNGELDGATNGDYEIPEPKSHLF
jgi:hypothetical protein